MGFFEDMMKKASESVEENNKKNNCIYEEIPFVEEKKEPIIKKQFNIEDEKINIENLEKELNILYKQISILENEEKKANIYYEIDNKHRTIHPFLLHGGRRDAYYKNGLIYVLMGSLPNASKEIFEFKDLDKNVIESIFKDGDELVFLPGGRFFKVIKKDDLDRKNKLQKELQNLYSRRKTVSSQIDTITKNINNYNFWEKYDIPFKFVVDIKPVHSGLLENSNGGGSNKATVFHLILKEDIISGRLKRKINDFLCTQPKGRHFYSTPYSTLEDENQEIVTCEQCLKMIEKYKF